MSKKVRTPIVVVVGHIDHGKSRLLDYIRHSNVVEKEAGGITQHISAYEAEISLKGGQKRKITFLDTPGHAAFSKMRTRGCNIADIAILIVSAEEGVKAQTIEAFKSIKECGIPYVVAINKIDKPGANVEKTKNSLVEKEIYLEGMGGDVPFVPISAETGEGVQELLETVALIADIEEFVGDDNVLGEGYVIEANMDSQRGVSASLVIKNGHLKTGMYVVSGKSLAPVRIMENFLGKPIREASFSNPVKITGWNEPPEVGSKFEVYKNKKDAGNKLAEEKNKEESGVDQIDYGSLLGEGYVVIPIIVKADTNGSVEAIIGEIEKIKEEKILIKIIDSKTGNISENDIKTAGSGDGSIIVGFNVKEDRGVDILAERLGVEVKTFSIIYKLTEWLEEIVKARKPKVKTEEVGGKTRILKIFSRTGDKQVVGGEVIEGSVSKGDKVRILRRGEEIGFGNVLELQVGKANTSSVNEGNQFGAKVSSSIEIAERDNFEIIKIIER